MRSPLSSSLTRNHVKKITTSGLARSNIIEHISGLALGNAYPGITSSVIDSSLAWLENFNQKEAFIITSKEEINIEVHKTSVYTTTVHKYFIRQNFNYICILM